MNRLASRRVPVGMMQNHTSQPLAFEVHSTLDREPPTFAEILYDWMERAPWLAISIGAHLILLLIVAIIPWQLLEEREEKVLYSSFEAPTEEIVEPDKEPEPEIVPEEVDEPVDLPVAEVFSETDSETLSDRSDPFAGPDSPAEFTALNLIGVGIGGLGEPGGPGGNKFGDGGTPSGTPIAERDAALRWLVAHQSPEGYWDADGFTDHCGHIGNGVCDGTGEAKNDVGATGLALLALLGGGNTTRGGAHKDAVVRCVKWLCDRQDPDTGLIADPLGKSFVYDQAIATLALCETYYISKSPLLRIRAQRAINWVSRARNPYGAWRYDVPPTGGNDTSVTGWMVMALKSAEDSGLQIDTEAYHGARTWFDEVTDPATARTGYDSIGSASARIDGLNDHYPTDGEAMTAVSLLCRILMGEDPKENDLLERQADLLLHTLPEWDPDGFGCDMYYWYYGSYAMFQMGGVHWRRWSKALKTAAVDTQRTDGDRAGSWDPIGPWGWSGGRVYSTALMALCLEAYYRKARVLGAR
ncbi:MAG: prenyltransferase/squalene oxidase repeat-containing protein [Planctomycetota bacterium]